MPHRRFFAPALASSAAVAVLMAAGASTAAAAPIAEHVHNTISFTVADDTACGIPGSATVNGVESFQILGDGTAKDQISLSEIFTSAATGKSVEISSAFQGASSAEVVNPDGSTTLVSSEKGLLEQIKLPNGPVLSRDAGALTFETTFSADGSLRSSTLVSEDGPHPAFDSGFAAACDVIVPALS